MINKSEHTPGPWSIDTRGGGLTIRATDKPNSNAWDIAHVTSGSGANAALIAAAPDMYDILNEVEEASRLRRPIRKATWLKVCEVLRRIDGKYR